MIETNEADLLLIEYKEFRSADLLGKPLEASYAESLQYIEDYFIDIAFIDADQFDTFAPKLNHESIVVINNTTLKVGMDAIAKKHKLFECRVESFGSQYLVYSRPNKLEEDVKCFDYNYIGTAISVVSQFESETTTIFIGSQELLKAFVYFLILKKNVIMPLDADGMKFVLESITNKSDVLNEHVEQQSLFHE